MRFDAGEGCELVLSADEDALCEIRFDGLVPEGIEETAGRGVLEEAAGQLREYFAGQRTGFTVPIRLKGTEFQRRVWLALRGIPYGATRCYAEIAQAIDAPKAVRAVGAANGRNPIPIIVPCHRVIGSNGKLTGFGGGLPLKRRLLDLECKALFDCALK